MSSGYESEAISMGEIDLLQPDAANIDSRIASLDWHAIANDLNESGNALLKGVLTSGECEALASLYANGEHFRSRVVMARHGFGRGEYQYFRYPLPNLLQQLRTSLYERLAPIANWPAVRRSRHAPLYRRGTLRWRAKSLTQDHAFDP